MKRAFVLGLVAALIASGCSMWEPPPPTRPPRTPVPTWTLAFEPDRETPTPDRETPTPVPVRVAAITAAAPPPDAATATATNTLVIAVETPTPEPSPSPTARPGIDPTLGASVPDPLAEQVLPIPEPAPQLHLEK